MPRFVFSDHSPVVHSSNQIQDEVGGMIGRGINSKSSQSHHLNARGPRRIQDSPDSISYGFVQICSHSMTTTSNFILHIGQVELTKVPPPDYLWENLQTVLLLPREMQSWLAGIFARLADQVESADPACGPAIRRMRAGERQVLARRLRKWWMIVSRISLAPCFSMRYIMVDLVPEATGLN